MERERNDIVTTLEHNRDDMLFEKGIKLKSKWKTTGNEKKNFYRKTHSHTHTLNTLGRDVN